MTLCEELKKGWDRLEVERHRIETVQDALQVLMEHYGMSDGREHSTPEPETDRVVLRERLTFDNPDLSVRLEKTKPQIVTDAVVDALTNEQPLHRDRILEILEEKGVAPSGKFPMESMSQYVSKDDRIQKLRNPKGHWALADYVAPTGVRPPMPTEEEVDAFVDQKYREVNAR